MVSLILMSAYTANLTAYLTVAQLGANFDTLKALAAQTRLPIGVPANSSIPDYFRWAGSGLCLKCGVL